MSHALETSSGLPVLEPGGGEGSEVGDDAVPTPKDEAVTTKHVGIVLAAFAAFQVIVGVGANWFFYTRSDGRVLEERFNSLKADQERIGKLLDTVASTVTALQFQQGKQVEALTGLTDSVRRLLEEQQNCFRDRTELKSRLNNGGK